MIAFAASLLGSKAGRATLIVALALASAAILIWRVFAAGKASAQADAARRSLDAIRSKVQSDEEIRSLPLDARRARLREWVRD